MKLVGGIIESLRKGENAPTRHHNPYLQQALELDDILFTQASFMEGKTDFFSKGQGKTILEIGCYMGKTLIEMAQLNPTFHFVGLDITYKRVVKSAKRIKTNGIKNAQIGICDGRVFVNRLADSSLQGVCVFFPDPWPKKKHLKNRLLNDEFLTILNRKLRPGGFLWFKTDSQDYFENVQQCINLNQWCESPADAIPKELAVSHPGQYTTSFEQLFISKEAPIWRRVFWKVD